MRLAAAYVLEEERFRDVALLSSGSSWALGHWADAMGGLFLTHRLAGTVAMTDFLGKEPWSAAVLAHEADVHSPLLAMVAEASHGIFTDRMNAVRKVITDEAPP